MTGNVRGVRSPPGHRQDRLHLGGPGAGSHPQLHRDGFDSLAPSSREADRRSSPSPSTRRSERSPLSSDRPRRTVATWSLTKLAEHLVRKGVVEDISHEGLRALLHEEGASFQALKSWKESNNPGFEAKKNRILELYDLADGKAQPAPGDPDVVVCHDEVGPLNLQPHPGHLWAERDEQGARRSGPRRRRRATYRRPHGVVHHLLCRLRPLHHRALWAHQGEEGRTEFLAFCATYDRSIRPGSASPSCSTTSAPYVDEDRRPGKRVGESQQRRARLHPAPRQLAQRGPVHRAVATSVSTARTTRATRPSLLDPALHRLTQQARAGSNAA